MKKYIIFFLLTSIIGFSSCMFFVSTTWINERIDPDVRTEIAGLNKKLFDALRAKDAKGVKNMMSKGLLDSAGTKIDTIISVLNNGIQSKTFKVVDEYYTTNATLGKNIILKSISSGDGYTIQYEAINRKSYVVLLKTEGQPINVSLLVSYGKYDDGWKINILNGSSYDAFGKNAPGYYDMAQQELRKGDTIDAADHIIIASQLGKPGGELFKYDNEDDMKDFLKSVISEANSTYHFPIVAKQIATQPQIFSISPQIIYDAAHGGFFPAIRYQTTIKLDDTAALKKENKALQKIIGNLFKGIDKDKYCILYAAFNQLPDNRSKVKHYGFVQLLN